MTVGSVCATCLVSEVLPRAHACRLCDKQCKAKKTWTGERSSRAHHKCLTEARRKLAKLSDQLSDARDACASAAAAAPAAMTPPPLLTPFTLTAERRHWREWPARTR